MQEIPENNHVILVDAIDREIGTEEKMRAHEKGLLHRAFSIFLFDDKKRMLLQRRAMSKYHSGGLWTNTCCSHPRPQESTEAAAHRRLKEELGFDCPLEEILQFTYHAVLDKGLTEHEFDHVFIGRYSNETMHLNPEEVQEVCFMTLDKLQKRVSSHPEEFTVWFRIILERVIGHFESLFEESTS